MRLIDADALKAALVPLWNCHDDSDFANKDVWRELENAPTIDAVPVVRCRDCMYWDKSWQTIEGCHYCGMIDKQTEGDFFCGDGEREKE